MRKQSMSNTLAQDGGGCAADAPASYEPTDVHYSDPQIANATGVPPAPARPTATPEAPVERQEITDEELLALAVTQEDDHSPEAAPVTGTDAWHRHCWLINSV